jgi:hypothetical protein
MSCAEAPTPAAQSTAAASSFEGLNVMRSPQFGDGNRGAPLKHS